MEATETAAATDQLERRIFSHSDDVAWVLVADEVVVYHTPSSTSHVLNPSAALLWQCFDGQSSLAEILTDFAAAFQVSGAQLLDDVAPAVLEWTGMGLVHEADRS